VSDNSRAYNSVWQLRGDAWCRLEEAADRLTRPTTDSALKERYVAICQDLLTQLTPLEPYWAYPGSPQFARVQRLFAAGSYDKFAPSPSRPRFLHGPPWPQTDPPTATGAPPADPNRHADHATTPAHTGPHHQRAPSDPHRDRPTQCADSPAPPAPATFPPETSDTPSADARPATAPTPSDSPRRNTH
jgi:hypothetical protein